MESLKATFHPRRLPTLVAGLAMTLAGVAASRAGVSDLRITEVNPATGQVEVTHLGSSSFTTASALPFCHSFNYGTSIPSGTTFGGGEFKTFTVSGLSSSASDIWLYRDGNFASSASTLIGIKYGTSASVGRTSVAVAAGIWPGTSAFIPLPRSGSVMTHDASANGWHGIGAFRHSPHAVGAGMFWRPHSSHKPDPFFVSGARPISQTRGRAVRHSSPLRGDDRRAN